jgi:hypothetical protein
MARICPQCKYYDASGQQDNCPADQTPLQFTLLPPPGVAAAPLPGVPPPTPPTPRASSASSGYGSRYGSGWGAAWGGLSPFFRYRIIAGLVLIPIALVLGAFFGFGKDSVKKKYDRIKVGMTMDEVEQILDPYPDPRSYRARYRAQGRWMADEGDDEGPGHWEWEEAGATISVDFMNGRVVRKSQKGLEK